jgi:cysteine desulfurase
MSAPVSFGSAIQTIYLDNASTTPIRDEVLSAILPYLREVYGNPSSIHHKGREASDALRHARMEVARAIGARASEIVFTSGGTESNTLALRGVLGAMNTERKHLLISAIEHSSVLATTEALSKEGYDVEYIPVDTYGLVHVDDVLTRARADTALISIMYGNNEIGTIEPIADIARVLRQKFPTNSPLFHTDACQASGQLPLDVTTLGIDLMTLNAGKMYGPKGAGMLYVRTGVRLAPTVRGGHQELGLRAGTENLAGIVGLARALSLATEETEAEATRLSILRDSFITSVQKAIPDVVLNGHPTLRLPNNIHFSFPSIEGEALVLLLDSYGICASTGSACNAEDLLPSHVLRAIKQPDELIHGSIRFSLGRNTTEDDIAYTISTLTACVSRLRALSPLPLHL